MVTSTALVIFLFAISMTQGSNHCPELCKCTADGKEVQCSGKHLELLPELQGTNITTLDFSFNNISLIRSHDFNVTGRQLKFFYLNHNRIKDVENSVFSKLPALMYLHLGHNLIAHVDPHTFHKNRNLWKLILDGNPLAPLEDTGIVDVPSLGWIELENCNISRLPGNLFKNVSKLVFIRLSNNQIQHLDLQLFSDLKQLRYLHLEGNQIQEIHPELFKSNHKLEWLYLRNNPLNQLSGHNFLHVPSLILLDISFCNISQIKHNSFSNLHNLMNLKLNNNLLKSFNMKHIPKNLRVLDISGNSMETINTTKDTIAHVANIEHLDLTENKFTCNCQLYDLWELCATLRKESGGMSSCDEFCPNSEFETCKGQHYKVHQLENTENFTTREPRKNHEYIDTTEADIDKDYDKSRIADDEVDVLEGMHNHSKDANEKTGKYKVIEGSASSQTGNILLYASIGTFAGLCLIGATVLGADLFFGRSRRSRTISAIRKLRLAKMKEKETNEEKFETVALTQQRGFDYLQVPTSVN
jgi:Leucine-rich repeat (LRR) protein